MEVRRATRESPASRLFTCGLPAHQTSPACRFDRVFPPNAPFAFLRSRPLLESRANRLVSGLLGEVPAALVAPGELGGIVEVSLGMVIDGWFMVGGG